mmetsp:Transcript_12879/g.42827  ORF Transcript_12879/g.42827 Transcript_12879/m.42827 type:complete len:206 (+) Transcript_12879:715-1332(+)
MHLRHPSVRHVGAQDQPVDAAGQHTRRPKARRLEVARRRRRGGRVHLRHTSPRGRGAQDRPVQPVGQPNPLLVPLPPPDRPKVQVPRWRARAGRPHLLRPVRRGPRLADRPGDGVGGRGRARDLGARGALLRQPQLQQVAERLPGARRAHLRDPAKGVGGSARGPDARQRGRRRRPLLRVRKVGGRRAVAGRRDVLRASQQQEGA